MNIVDVRLENIHKNISIHNEDQKTFAKMFDEIKDWIINEMCKMEPVFKKLYKETCLLGSYSNQGQILKPNEFCIYFIFKFPCPMDVILLEGSPGFVRLDLWKTLKNLEKDPNYRDVHNVFVELVRKTNQQNCLNHFSFESWVKDILEKVLKTRSVPNGYNISYSKSNVVQNIQVYEKSSPQKIVSIDFLPAINIGKDDKLENLRRFAQLKGFKSNNLLVIPSVIPTEDRRFRTKDDRIKFSNNAEYTFQIVNAKEEQNLLWEKPGLKIVYHLLTLLRNHYCLNSLKSYFLTTIFLWEVENQNDKFWNKSVSYLLLHMLGKLSKYFADRKLPCYWIDNFDLFTTLKTKDVIKYSKTLAEVLEKIKIDIKEPSNDKLAAHFKAPPK